MADSPSNSKGYVLTGGSHVMRLPNGKRQRFTVGDHLSLTPEQAAAIRYKIRPVHVEDTPEDSGESIPVAGLGEPVQGSQKLGDASAHGSSLLAEPVEVIAAAVEGITDLDTLGALYDAEFSEQQRLGVLSLIANQVRALGGEIEAPGASDTSEGPQASNPESASSTPSASSASSAAVSGSKRKTAKS